MVFFNLANNSLWLFPCYHKNSFCCISTPNILPLCSVHLSVLWTQAVYRLPKFSKQGVKSQMSLHYLCIFQFFSLIFFPNISGSYTVRCQTEWMCRPRTFALFSQFFHFWWIQFLVAVVFLSVTFVLSSSVQQTSSSLIQILLALVVVLPLGIRSISSRYKSSLSPDLIWHMCMFVFSLTLLSFSLSAKSHSTIMSGFIS